ncbi:MAG: CPBP family intramembrane metalloprotease [Planctomycetes bacterium]|nr:CPBP family intramembrane metalloprotease [Planctomycetota bacterium]
MTTRQRRLALLALFLIVPAPSFGASMALWIAPGAVGAFAYSVGKGVLYGLPLVWHRLLDKERWSLSLPSQGGLGVGLALGLFIALVIQLTWYLVGPSLDTSRITAAVAENGLDSKAAYLSMCVYFCTVNAALEEYVFRWFIYSRFRQLMAAGPAVALAGLAFTAHHVIVLRAFFDWPFALVGSLGVLVGGLFWSACYARYKSIWPGYVSHVFADVSILVIGYQILFPA